MMGGPDAHLVYPLPIATRLTGGSAALGTCFSLLVPSFSALSNCCAHFTSSVWPCVRKVGAVKMYSERWDETPESIAAWKQHGLPRKQIFYGGAHAVRQHGGKLTSAATDTAALGGRGLSQVSFRGQVVFLCHPARDPRDA